MKLRILFFAASLLVSVYFGLYTDNSVGGWLAAIVIASAGLGWTSWDDSGAVYELPQPARDEPDEGEGKEAEVSAGPPRAFISASSVVFQGYFDSAPVPLLIMNSDGRIVRMNQAAELATGFAAAELGDSPYWQAFLGESQFSEAESDYRHAMLMRNAPPRSETWRTRSGAPARFEWHRSVLKDEFGLAAGLIAAGIPARPEKPSVNFSALADQLTAVNGYSELLLMSMDESDPMRHDLESIHNAGRAASSSLTSALN